MDILYTRVNRIQQLITIYNLLYACITFVDSCCSISDDEVPCLLNNKDHTTLLPVECNRMAIGFRRIAKTALKRFSYTLLCDSSCLNTT